MEIKDNKLPNEMFSQVKDIIAGAFKFETGKYERAKYIVEKLKSIYGNEKYNFCCIVGNKGSYGAFYSYYKDVFLRCNFEDQYIVLFSGK